MNIKQHFKIPFAIVAFLLLVGLGHSASAQESFKKETLTENKFERKAKKKKAVVIDVRTAEEYKEGHLPNAVNIDVQQANFMQQVQQLDKQKTYLLYCRTGKRSEKALKAFKEVGFDKVYHLKGGITAWQGAKVQ